MAFTTILVNIVTFPQDALQIQGSQWQIIQSSQFLTKKKNTCILFIFDITHNSFYYHIYPLQICFLLLLCPLFLPPILLPLPLLSQNFFFFFIVSISFTANSLSSSQYHSIIDFFFFLHLP